MAANTVLNIISFTPDEARHAILGGVAPSGMVVNGDLEFDGASGLSRLPHDLRVRGQLSIWNCDRLRSLPRGLRCDTLIIWESGITRLPERLHVSKKLTIGQCPLTQLPRKLRSGPLELLRLVQSPRVRELPAGLRVTGEHIVPRLTGYTMGSLDVRGCARLRTLPSGLQLHALDARDCVRLRWLPDDLRISDTLDVSGCVQLEALPGGRWPTGLWVDTLKVARCTHLRAIPANLWIKSRLMAAHCASLESLPEGLDVSTIDLRGCTGLRTLPARLRVYNLNLAGCVALAEWPRDGLPATLRQLDISGCTSLTNWPATGPAVLRRLTMRGCVELRSLPPWLRQVNKLDIRDCPNLRELPQGLRVPGWIDLAGTPLQDLPPAARGCRVRWRGVLVPWHVVLQPETITARDALRQANAEVRRVMIERMGFERFLREARAETLNADRDIGGPRQLLRVAFPNDEPLVCLAVYDPSTGRQYLLRVPPQMRSCRQAAAWIAGFDDPDDYHPAAET